MPLIVLLTDRPLYLELAMRRRGSTEWLSPLLVIVDGAIRRFSVLLFEMPPPKPASLLRMTLLTTLTATPPKLFSIPPPLRSAVLLLMVLPVMLTVPNRWTMPPPSSASLFWMVVLMIFAVANIKLLLRPLKMPPPSSALLLLMVLFRTFSVPLFKMPAPALPKAPRLSLTSELVTFTVPVLRFNAAPGQHGYDDFGAGDIPGPGAGIRMPPRSQHRHC